MFPSRPYILLVEDDEDDVLMFKDYFSQQNSEVDLIHFDTGRDALNFLAGTPPENLPKVLLLDRMLPARRAVDILSSLGTDDKFNAIVKVVWSTYCLPADQDQLISLGASHYLNKPTTPQEWNAVGKQLSRHFQRQANSPL